MVGQPQYTSIPPLFIFGDSLSDTGRLRRETLGLFPPDPPYAKGRLSNGAVAVEYLAAALGIPFKQDDNYAIAGANAGRDNINDNLFIKLDGFLDQIDGFKDDVPKSGANPNGLYVIWIGANDLFNGADTPAKTVKTIIENLETGVSELVKTGARYITLATSPNLGRTPFAQNSDTPASETTALVERFNSQLKTAIAGWQTTYKRADLLLADVFPTGEAIARDPASYGFTNTETAYLKDLEPADPNANPDEYFFWDQVHPTTRAHSLYGRVFEDTIVNGITDDVAYVGSNRSDRLVGYGGDDALKGQYGHDELLGNAGDDTLLGGQDNDWLDGGTGQNILRGGQGTDTFVVQADSSKDKILDFVVGEDQLAPAGALKEAELMFKAARIGTKIQWTDDRTASSSTLAVLRDVSVTALVDADIFNVA